MDGHAPEQAGYVAIYSPVGSGWVDLGNGQSLPYRLMRLKANNQWTTVLSQALKLEEEKSADKETKHPNETIDVLGLGNHLFAQIASFENEDTVALRRLTQEDPAAVEWGTITGVNHNWGIVPLAKKFTNPVAVVVPAGSKSSKFGVARIQNVVPFAFDVRFQKWDYLDGKHRKERLFYLVVEAGQQNMAGHTIMAGALKANQLIQNGDVAVDLAGVFAETPAIFASVMTQNGIDAVTTRIRNPSAAGFGLGMQHEEANSADHVTETLGWIAISPGVGMTTDKRDVEVTMVEANNAASLLSFMRKYNRKFPVVLQQLMTTNGLDTAIARQQKLTKKQVEVLVMEEKSLNKELRHGKETIGVFVAE